MRIYIPKSLRNEIVREFHDKPIAGPHPASRIRRNRYVLVITDHFSKWAEILPRKRASARVIADTFFDNDMSRFRAPVKLISGNGPQFISDIFEHLSDRLGIRHVKTAVYRPQANRTKRLNRVLVQMIANYVNDQHYTWDQFLREFAYAIRMAVNETMGKTPAELFLDWKLITPFQKLVMVSDGTEFAVGQIERLFDEARRDKKAKHEKREKYYDRRRRDVQIKVNDWILIKTHPLSSATKKVIAKFKPKFEGPYRVLEKDQGERHTDTTDKHGPLLRPPPGSWSEPNRKVKIGDKVGKRTLSLNSSNDLPQFKKKVRTEETVMPSTSGYNLQPRRGAKVEFRPTNEKRTQQGGPVRARGSRKHQYSPYIEEQARSRSRNTRSKSGQQQHCQERKGGVNSNRSLSLEVLVGEFKS
ncbi:retrovirus-related Pol polyprotein from transposon 297 [Trichonephila clavipes]|nr:retrovirus-related Pol polyprotein from transposon 297 [Trichonephila clavipes]